MLLKRGQPPLSSMLLGGGGGEGGAGGVGVGSGWGAASPLSSQGADNPNANTAGATGGLRCSPLSTTHHMPSDLLS